MLSELADQWGLEVKFPVAQFLLVTGFLLVLLVEQAALQLAGSGPLPHLHHQEAGHPGPLPHLHHQEAGHPGPVQSGQPSLLRSVLLGKMTKHQRPVPDPQQNLTS